MPSQREFFDDPEEGLRVPLGGFRAHMWTALPVAFSQDSADGHTGTLQPSIKRPDDETSFSTTAFSDLPVLPNAPIHHPGGGGITSTFPSKEGDEGIAIFASRSIDGWHQSGGVQQPIFNRLHHLSDAMVIPGVRSDPRKLHQVSQTSNQTRTDDKKSVIDHGPNGTHHKTVDPSTAAASETFDPFAQATKFFEHILHPTNGHAVNATDGGTTHSTSLDHDAGFKAAANNGAHSIAAHPTNGVGIKSSTAHTVDAPNLSLDQSGNLAPKGNIAGGGNISAQGLISGAAIAAGGFSFGGGGGGGAGNVSFGGVTSTAQPLAGPMLQFTESYTVQQLADQFPPSRFQGLRAFVTDATAPSFLAVLQGGGAIVCPAFCDGTNWVAA